MGKRTIIKTKKAMHQHSESLKSAAIKIKTSKHHKEPVSSVSKLKIHPKVEHVVNMKKEPKTERTKRTKKRRFSEMSSESTNVPPNKMSTSNVSNKESKIINNLLHENDN